MQTDDTSMRERMLAGRLYLADDPELVRESERAHRITHRINSMDPTDRAGVRALLDELLGALGDGSVVRPPVRLDYGYQTSIGARTFVNWGLICVDVANVTLGDDVQIGPGVQLLTATHPLEADPRRDKWEAAEPITIEDNAWLGGGVIVCPGVHIGADTVVGAGSVVTHDLPESVLAVGSPARVSDDSSHRIPVCRAVRDGVLRPRRDIGAVPLLPRPAGIPGAVGAARPGSHLCRRWLDCESLGGLADSRLRSRPRSPHGCSPEGCSHPRTDHGESRAFR